MALTENRVSSGANTKAQVAPLDKEMEKNTSVAETPEFDGDIDLSSTRKKRFRIDGDNDRWLELNTSDMGIVSRLNELYPKLQKLTEDASLKQLESKDSDEDLVAKVSKALVKIDVEMRNIIDEIFDSNVSEVCAPSGSMFDPFNGEFRFEHIIDVLSKLYTNNLNSEFKKMSEKMKKKTAKYTKGK